MKIVSLLVLLFWIITEILMLVNTEEIVYVKSGSVLNLTCPYKSTTEPLIWRGPANLTTYSINNMINVGIKARGRVAIVGNFKYGRYILSVKNFSSEDAGFYRCDTAVDGRTTDHLIKVIKAEPPRNLEVANSDMFNIVYAHQGSKITLTCTVEQGIPYGNISWCNGDTNLVSNNSSIVIYGFNITKHDHNLELTCKASNSFYTTGTKIHLYVYTSPEVKLIMEPSSTLEEGYNITLTCNFTTTTYQNNVTWTRNGQNITEVHRTYLFIQNVSRKDTGEYSCHVKNAIGDGADSISVFIKYKPFTLDGSTIYKYESEKGKVTNISIIVYSPEAPGIAWTTSLGGKLGIWTVNRILNDTFRLTSTIVPYEVNDYREYGVRVRNTVGSIDLDVELVRFTVQVYPISTICNTSKKTSFMCNITSKNTTWLRNEWVHLYKGSVIRTITGMVKDNLSLMTITYCDYRDAGIYMCKWESGTVSYTESSSLIVHSPPILASKTIREYDKQLILEVMFYSEPKAYRVSWMYNDKIMLSAIADNHTMQAVDVSLVFYGKSVKPSGYRTSFCVNQSKEYDFRLFSCQIKNNFGYLDASFDDQIYYERPTTRMTTDHKDENKNSSNLRAHDTEKNKHTYVYSSLGSVFLFLIIGFTIMLYRCKTGKCGVDIHVSGVGTRDSETTGPHTSRAGDQNVMPVHMNIELSNDALYEDIDSLHSDPVVHRLDQSSSSSYESTTDRTYLKVMSDSDENIVEGVQHDTSKYETIIAEQMENATSIPQTYIELS